MSGWRLAGARSPTSRLWVGAKAGTALTGFIQGALQRTSGDHPDVNSWVRGVPAECGAAQRCAVVAGQLHAGIPPYHERSNDGMDQWRYWSFVLGNDHPGEFGITWIIPGNREIGRRGNELTGG
jgi:hypothetical protein